MDEVAFRLTKNVTDNEFLEQPAKKHYSVIIDVSDLAFFLNLEKKERA
jgi:hypothetical protein